MASKIFVNLPVKNLDRSIEFFTQLGFKFDPKFTDENATCMIISDNIFVMLLVEERFMDFTNKKIARAKETTEVLLAIDAPSREAVDALVQKAVNAGGNSYMEPEDHGWMYGNNFEDLDGHQWEIFYMEQEVDPEVS